MRLSIDFISRIFGALFIGFLGAKAGESLAQLLDLLPDAYIIIFSLIGFLGGLILTPYFTTRPIRQVRYRLVSMPPERLGAIIMGIFLGLIATALVSFPLSFLPSPFQEIAPLATAFVFCYLSIVVLTLRQSDLRVFFTNFRPVINQPQPSESLENHILLDTSVIIDGRITDICKTGFLRGTLLVPYFVLNELQHIADSADSLRRNRGRRGLDVLTLLRQESPIPIKLTDMDADEARDVDSKLMALARQLHCPIMTNDYNLNRVAELQGISVLNINDLANAVKASYLPGEILPVKIIQDGKEFNQGVGYLVDGTMVVVEDGRQHMNELVNVTVTKVLQTTAGRMVFAKP